MLTKAIKSLSGRRRNVNEHIAAADEQRDVGNWTESARLYRIALDLDDSLEHVWVQYGHSLKEGGDFPAAEGAYKRALALIERADTHLQLGHLHKIMGRVREAEQDYLRAFDLQPESTDVRLELGNMSWSAARLRRRRDAAKPEELRAVVRSPVAFELSDLIDHLQRSRYPTGIQRVQLCLAEALLHEEEPPHFVYFEHISSRFYEVDPSQVSDIVDVVNNVDRADEARTDIVDRLKTAITTRPPYDFEPGACLVNVGTSWGFLNYFLTIREAKRRSGIRYVPMVHDCIPLLFPEFCNLNLVSDFVNWISLMLEEADLVLSNSENTRKDLVAVAEQLQLATPPVAVLHLNGEYGSGDGVQGEDPAAAELLSLHDLDVADYVLFVSTIEPRKNHMLALNAWSQMLKNGDKQVPKLVCVGSSGWMNDAFHERLSRDRALGETVVVLRDVSDQLLKLLYRNAMFTLFPSLYEGWGLPISEALAHGKVPLVSNISSHPEAGGDLAVYFDLASEADFRAKLAHLINDEPARRALEKRIVEGRPLRPWREIGEEMLRDIAPLGLGSGKPLGETAPRILQGRYYSFARNLQDRIEYLRYSGDPLRRGYGWYAPEPFGCWVRGQMGELCFSLPDGDAQFEVFLQLAAPSHIANSVTVSVPGKRWSNTSHRHAAERWWERISVRVDEGSSRIVTLRLSGASVEDFANASHGVDRRQSALAVLGLYVCPTGDAGLRQALTEAILLNEFSGIANRFPQSVLV